MVTLRLICQNLITVLNLKNLLTPLLLKMSEKRKETTIEERKIILSAYKQNKTIREICTLVNRPRTTIAGIIKRFKDDPTCEYQTRSGRPPALSVREKREIVKIIKKEPKTSSSEIAAMLKENTGTGVHPRTVRRVLNSAGYNARVCRKKPQISKVNQMKRLSFAKEHINKGIDFWDKVIFSDESKFSIYKSDGRVLTWRKKGEALQEKHIQSTVKHGGAGVMVWGCMSAAGVGELVFIDEVMDKNIYLNILKDNLHKSAQKLGIESDYFFQQDNDPKHTAEIGRLWILYNTPHTLKTPPQSPDINPIEHLWDHLDRRIREHHITSKNMLKEKLMEEWEKIDPEVTKKLVHSMQKRLQEIIKNNGKHTSY